MKFNGLKLIGKAPIIIGELDHLEPFRVNGERLSATDPEKQAGIPMPEPPGTFASSWNCGPIPAGLAQALEDQ